MKEEKIILWNVRGSKLAEIEYIIKRTKLRRNFKSICHFKTRLTSVAMICTIGASTFLHQPWAFCNTVGLLICTFVSQHQGFEKLRSVSNFRKISDYFSLCHLDFFSGLWYKSIFFLGRDLKKIQVCRTWNF